MPDNEQTIKLSDLSDDALLSICRAADVIACECPGYIARLLRQVRAFRSYTLNCIEQFPKDAETHYWLADRANQVEAILWQTMVELMQREALVSESEEVLLDNLSERARAIALEQIGGPN